jgi:hypothetical protein
MDPLTPFETKLVLSWRAVKRRAEAVVVAALGSLAGGLMLHYVLDRL